MLHSFARISLARRRRGVAFTTLTNRESRTYESNMLLAVTGVDEGIIDTYVLFDSLCRDCDLSLSTPGSLLDQKDHLKSSTGHLGLLGTTERIALAIQLVPDNSHISPSTYLCLVCTYYIIRAG